MKKLEFIFAVTQLILFAGCTDKAPTSATVPATVMYHPLVQPSASSLFMPPLMPNGLKTIDGSDAKSFIAALENSGVKVNIKYSGIKFITSRQIFCNSPLLSGPVVCSIQFGDRWFQANEKDSGTLFSALSNKGAGIDAKTAHARSIFCNLVGICNFMPPQSAHPSKLLPALMPHSIKTIAGDSAQLLITSLENSGVLRSNRFSETAIIKARQIYCSIPAQGRVSCSIQHGDEWFDAKPADSSNIYNILMSKEAGLGLSEKTTAVHIRSVFCDVSGICSFMSAESSDFRRVVSWNN